MMLSDIFPIGLIACGLAVLWLLLFGRKLLVADRRRAACLFAARFLGLWWAMTTIALLFKTRTFLLNEHGDPFQNVNLVPFLTIGEYLADRNWLQLLGNALIFTPFPLLLRANFPSLKRAGFYTIIAATLLLIEPLQALINLLWHGPVNVIDIDDLLLNAAGCLLGLAALALYDGLKTKKEAAYE